jgi:hypothetical protein
VVGPPPPPLAWPPPPGPFPHDFMHMYMPGVEINALWLFFSDVGTTFGTMGSAFIRKWNSFIKKFLTKSDIAWILIAAIFEPQTIAAK